MVTRKKQECARGNVDFSGRSYRRYDRETFQNNLADLAAFYESNNPDEMWDIMEGYIIQQANLQCPIKKFKVKAQREPWLTNKAMEAIRDKDRLLKKAKRTRKEQDWATARMVRNQVGRDLENLRDEFLKREQQAHAGDPKQFWANISSIFPGKKGRTCKIWLKDSESGREVDSEQTANYINNYFTSIGPNLARKFDQEWRYYGETLQRGIENMVTNIEEVHKLCKGINTMKSSGIDVLSSRLCKDAFMALEAQLVYLFTCSLATGRFPNKWKTAKIIPLFKGGDRENVNNYRPVSLLPIPGKLLEKIVHVRIVEFWEANNFLTDKQGGFRKGHSTVATIADLTDDFFHQINSGNTSIAAFVNLRKAFDTVNTTILLRKLNQAGIKGVTLHWCENYLSGRVLWPMIPNP